MSEEQKNTKPEINEKAGFIPYLFFIFFGVIFLVNFSYIFIAKSTWRGLQTKGSYEKGVNYNETLHKVEEQKNLGWNLDLKYERTGENSAILKACLRDKNKKLITDAKLRAKIARPTQEGYDFIQDFVQEKGCYLSRVSFPLKGQWDVEIRAFKDDFVFQEVKRYVVR